MSYRVIHFRLRKQSMLPVAFPGRMPTLPLTRNLTELQQVGKLHGAKRCLRLAGAVGTHWRNSFGFCPVASQTFIWLVPGIISAVSPMTDEVMNGCGNSRALYSVCSNGLGCVWVAVVARAEHAYAMWPVLC
jgi:hypothetical protein